MEYTQSVWEKMPCDEAIPCSHRALRHGSQMQLISDRSTERCPPALTLMARQLACHIPSAKRDSVDVGFARGRLLSRCPLGGAGRLNRVVKDHLVAPFRFGAVQGVIGLYQHALNIGVAIVPLYTAYTGGDLNGLAIDY